LSGCGDFAATTSNAVGKAIWPNHRYCAARWNTCRVKGKRLNLLIVIGNVIMLMVILLIVVALFIGWIDGSLEGYEGLLRR
jgi:hypothetical protein